MKMATFKTERIQLAAFILASLPPCEYKIISSSNSAFKTIEIYYSSSEKEKVDKLVDDFFNRRSVVNLYSYNTWTSALRDAIRRTRNDK